MPMHPSTSSTMTTKITIPVTIVPFVWLFVGCTNIIKSCVSSTDLRFIRKQSRKNIRSSARLFQLNRESVGKNNHGRLFLTTNRMNELLFMDRYVFFPGFFQIIKYKMYLCCREKCILSRQKHLVIMNESIEDKILAKSKKTKWNPMSYLKL